MKWIDSKKAVKQFLSKAHSILLNPCFDIHKNFYMKIIRNNYVDNNKHTNKSTLIDLDYGLKDVVNEILQLKVENYKETVEDNKINKANPFYCFIKKIKSKNVYIKFKIREENNEKIFCVSFHFTEFEITNKDLPYNN